MRWLVKRSLPSLIETLSAVQPQVTETPAALGSLTRGLALAGRPPDEDSPGAELMAKRARLGLVLEEERDHKGSMPSMIESDG